MSARYALAMRPARIARPFRPAGIKDFTYTYQPFNMTICHGVGGGINFYNEGGVPVGPSVIGSGSNAFSFNFSLSGMQTLINGGGAASNGGGVNNINVNEYTNLFDSYRLIGIEIKMIYSGNDVTANQTTNSLPTIMMVNDYDDSNNTSVASLLQYDSLKTFQMGSGNNNSWTWRMRPKLQASIQTTGGAVLSMTPSRGAWIDTLSPDAQYFGVKGYVDLQTVLTGGTSPTPMGFITFYVKAKVQFKNTK